MPELTLRNDAPALMAEKNEQSNQRKPNGPCCRRSTRGDITQSIIKIQFNGPLAQLCRRTIDDQIVVCARVGGAPRRSPQRMVCLP